LTHLLGTPALHIGSGSTFGPTLPTLALQQVGSYLGYTGRAANVIAKAALDPKETSTCAGVIVCCGSVRDAHNRNYITYTGNKLQLVRKGDDNTSLHSPLAADETLYMRQPVRQGGDNTSLHSPIAVDETPYMRQPVRQGDDNTIQGFVLKQKKHNLHLQHKAIYQRKL
jgi:hypothetical protein